MDAGVGGVGGWGRVFDLKEEEKNLRESSVSDLFV